MMRKFIALTAAAAGVLWLGIVDGGRAEAQELKKATVRLAFTYNAHRSPYLLGRDKGFYKAEGLDVDVLEGKGVTSSMQLVSGKQDTFAVVDPPSLMLGVAQGMPLKTVLQLYQRSSNAVISWNDANIKAPQDLVGKTVASLQGDTTTTMLYALLAKNGVNRNDVKIFASDGGTRNQTFLGKRAEAIIGFTNDSYLSLRAQAPEIRMFPFTEFGINTMGDGIVVHDDTIKSSPELIRGFVKATIQAYEYAVDHPDEAVDSLLKVTKSPGREVEIEKLRATKPLLSSADTKEHGIGYNSKAEWQNAEALMLEFGGLTKKSVTVEDYYTNAFLPKQGG